MCPVVGSSEWRVMQRKPYRKLVGSVMYLLVATRPDINYAVSNLAKYFDNPGLAHWKAAIYLLKYLKGTVFVGLTYTRGTSDSFVPVGFSDADWAGCLDTRRSRSGGVIMLAGNPIWWVSKLQTSVALSSAESEITALLVITKCIVWVVHILNQMKLMQSKPVVVFEDNSSCIDIVNNPIINDKSKHMDIHYHYVKENIERKVIDVQKIKSEDNIADLFTKPLAWRLFVKLRDVMLKLSEGSYVIENYEK
jgi:hypothetical protein